MLVLVYCNAEAGFLIGLSLLPMDDKPNDDVLELLRKRFEVKDGPDGSFTVYTRSGTYLITKIDSSSPVSASASNYPQSLIKEDISESQTSGNDNPFAPLIKNEDEKERFSPFGRIGEDDIAPDLDPKLKKKSRIKGMMPSPDNLNSSDGSPFIDVDPAYPSKKKKDRGPEPDPDHYDPGRNVFD